MIKQQEIRCVYIAFCRCHKAISHYADIYYGQNKIEINKIKLLGVVKQAYKKNGLFDSIFNSNKVLRFLDKYNKYGSVAIEDKEINIDLTVGELDELIKNLKNE
jgi:hypothetical protein